METKNVNLRRENAMLKMQLDSKNRQLEQVSKDYKSLNEQFGEIKAHYTKLYDETKHLIYSLERKEHDLNYLRAKMTEKEAGRILIYVDHSGTFSLVLGKLQSDLKTTKAEADRLLQLWIQSQKEGLEIKERIAILEEENILLNVILN